MYQLLCFIILHVDAAFPIQVVGTFGFTEQNKKFMIKLQGKRVISSSWNLWRKRRERKRRSMKASHRQTKLTKQQNFWLAGMLNYQRAERETKRKQTKEEKWKSGTSTTIKKPKLLNGEARTGFDRLFKDWHHVKVFPINNLQWCLGRVASQIRISIRDQKVDTKRNKVRKKFDRLCMALLFLTSRYEISNRCYIEFSPPPHGNRCQ